MKNQDETKEIVRQRYAEVARAEGGSSCCGPSCCGPQVIPLERLSAQLGYSSQDLGAVPAGANLGLGCGNPQAIAGLRLGEVVLDLGCGAGFDCFLAARQVGESGWVIGVDMTPEMLDRARRSAKQGGYRNVEFRLGEIEHLPVPDNSVDVIISNCVINLSPDKAQVCREAYRVLRPGGRLAISDVVALEALPAAIKEDADKFTGCVAGAATIDEWRRMLAAAGFVDIKIELHEHSREIIKNWFPGRGLEDLVASANITARKGE